MKRTPMRWTYKAHILALLTRLPAGRSMYHALQRVGGTNKLRLEEEISRTIEIAELIREAGGAIPGATVYEVGTGWRPFVPFVLRLLGAERIVTVDVNPWLSADYALETCDALASQLDRLAQATGVPVETLRSRYLAAQPRQRNLAELLKAFHVEYVCPGDARSTGLPEATVDIVVSSNVLEHIPLDIQTAIHRESLRILRPGGLIAHRFNPGDHYANGDGSIHTANFLRFSPAEWHWYGGSGLAYHNRLRTREYDEMFAALGYDVVVRRTRVDARARAELEAGIPTVHPDFSRFTLDELAADYMWIAARKPNTRNHH